MARARRRFLRLAFNFSAAIAVVALQVAGLAIAGSLPVACAAGPGAAAAVWPYAYAAAPQPAATCHTDRFNIYDPYGCSVDSCGPYAQYGRQLRFNATSATECCKQCSAYRPGLPSVYGGRTCNAFTFCKGRANVAIKPTGIYIWARVRDRS